MTWPVVELGQVAETALGKMLDRGKSRGHSQTPYLRNINVHWGRIDTGDLLTMEISDGERERFSVRTGDLLVCEGGEIGRCAIWQGPSDVLAYQKALHRVRPRDGLDTKFLRYLLQHYSLAGNLSMLSTGTTIAHLPQQQLRRMPVPLPELTEQRRIVDLLEDHFSQVDAGMCAVTAAAIRLERLRDQIIYTTITGADLSGRHPAQIEFAGTSDGDLSDLPAGWQWARLGEVAEVKGGITKDAIREDNSDHVEVPYLRVANVQRGHLKLDVVTSIRVPNAKAKALELEFGDILLNEGGDRDKLARGWVWEDQIPRCIHQNHVFRARLHELRLDPYFLSWTANSIGGKWAERNGRQSVNLASISLTTIRKMPIIVPPPGVARARARQLADQLEDVARVSHALDATRQRGLVLRRCLLDAAFSGRLTSRTDPSGLEETITK